MKTTIDQSGRVVVPKPIRDRLGLRGGETLDIEVRDGMIELSPATTEVELIATAEGTIARPVSEVPPMTDDLVREVLEQVRG